VPLRNRVSPLGELEAVPERGLLYGNRGNLHAPDGRIVRPYQVRRWIACALHFRGRRRHPLLQPGRYTELFFLDEATAFAAGHRPCAECRNADYKRFVQLWRSIHPGQSGADAMDVQLHEERYDREARAPRLHRAPWSSLPGGTVVLRDGEPWLVRGDAVLRWTQGGYTTREPRPVGGDADVVTPPSLVDVLRAGWQPLLHPSAG
jgi:hypothetical protein